VKLDFPQTSWSLVVSASGKSETALEELCRVYWRPVYEYLRRARYSPSDSEDLTQSFFVRLVRQDDLFAGGEIKGRLRFYLVGALKRHLADHHRKAGAEKRGAGKAHLPLLVSEREFEDAEHCFVEIESGELSPDRAFDQRWALDLLERAHQKIRAQYASNEKLEEYEILKPAIAISGEVDTADMAVKLGMGRDSVRVVVHRLRKNFRAVLKGEIAETVLSHGQVEEELASLLQVFS